MYARDLDWFWITSNWMKRWLKFLSQSLRQEMENHVKWQYVKLDVQLSDDHSIHCLKVIGSEDMYLRYNVCAKCYFQQRKICNIYDTMYIACSVSKYTAQASATYLACMIDLQPRNRKVNVKLIKL